VNGRTESVIDLFDQNRPEDVTPSRRKTTFIELLRKSLPSPVPNLCHRIGRYR
jgi:hypothetical protein